MKTLRAAAAGELAIPAGQVELAGILEAPERAAGVVVFSHGSGSGHNSPRNRFVAGALHRVRIATLLLDLLTPEEDRDYETRFDIPLLSQRLAHALGFVCLHASTRGLPIGLFGASTGAASALRVAAERPRQVAAVVSRGGRPDLAGDDALARVEAPTLLIVGGEDAGVIELNEAAAARLARCEHDLAIVPGATHLFEEPGKLEEVARLASDWFARHLAGVAAPATLARR